MKMWLRFRTNDRQKNRTAHGKRLRNAVFACALGATAAFFLSASPAASAFGARPATLPVASASSINGNSARLNGAPMAAGATLFPGDVIRLGEGSTAALQFGKSLVIAAPETEFVVQQDGVGLRDGRLQVRANGAQSFAVSGPFFRVDVAGASGAPSTAEIRFGKMRAQITAVAGFADVSSDGYDTAYRLRAGETATLDASSEAASPQASQDAGEVTRLTPAVQIDRDLQRLVAAVSQHVLWGDDLRSGSTGRAHITLTDGSQLNLGSDSSLLILRHDAQAQQSSLDLVVGRMRGQIIKLTKPAASFEVRTPMGVAGLVGTDFSLLVTPDYAELMVFDGVVRFTTLQGKSIVVNAGMKVRISKEGVLDGPTMTTPQEEQLAKNLTDVTEAPPGTQTATLAPGKRHLVPIIVTLSGAAAAGVGIGVYELTRPKVSNSTP
jgi:ferric-dicitrate binding protein FerR (iron transport regulator)